MAQHDYTIADADGASFLADLNDFAAAAASTNKGNARPSTAYAGQLWLDDNTPSSTRWTLYLYDGTDDIKVGEFDTTTNKFYPVPTNRFAAGSFTYDVATTGSLSVTGLGFTPRRVRFDAVINTTGAGSRGFDNGTVAHSIALNNGGVSGQLTNNGSSSIYLYTASGAFALANITSMDADGFTIGRSKTGAPTGTATVFYEAEE